MGQSLLSLLLVGKHKTPEQLERQRAMEKEFARQHAIADAKREEKERIKWEKKQVEENKIENELLDKLSDEILGVFNNYFNVFQITRIRDWNGNLRLTLKNDLDEDKKIILNNMDDFKKHKYINKIYFYSNEIFINPKNINNAKLGDILWNKIHPVKQVNQPTQTPKVNVSSSVVQNEPKYSENIVNNSNNINTSDIDKQLELLKRQQEILDRQIELEKLKQQNRN